MNEEIKATHEWVKRYGNKLMPKNIIEWYKTEVLFDEYEKISQVREKKFETETWVVEDLGYIIDNTEEDTQDELNLLDSYNEIGYVNEDRENSQELALELMEENNELERL